MTSAYSLHINRAWGGMIDGMFYNGKNLTGQGAGGAFQMAVFDDSRRVTNARQCDQSQGAVYNPTQSGSCGKGSRIDRWEKNGLFVALCPRLFAFDAESNLKWWQTLIPQQNRPNHFQLLFHSKQFPTKDKPWLDLKNAHGKYSNYAPPECNRAWFLQDGQVQARDFVPGLQMVNGQPRWENYRLVAPGWCVIGRPDGAYGFGLKRSTLNQEWAIQPTPNFCCFGQGAELQNWSTDVFDEFQFSWGRVAEILSFFQG